jgi:tetratricopeptide (TPR) repeat protein
MAIMVSAPAFSAEEPFDTATAAKHVEQGVAFLKAKNFDAAINEFEEAASVNPDAEAYYYLGYAYYLKGKKGDGESRKKSRESFEKAYEINPNFTPSRYKPAGPAPAKETKENQEPAETQKQPETQQLQPTSPSKQPK